MFFSPIPAHCSRPKAVANADIEAGDRAELHSRLRYSCKPGYKRKAGTSSLIQCILWNGSEARWTHPTLQCIRENLGEFGISPLQLPQCHLCQQHLMGWSHTPPGHQRTFQQRTHPRWDRARPRCPSHPRIMLQVGPIPNSPGLVLSTENLLFSLLSTLLFSEAAPSIHPFPTFAAQNFLFSPLFQFPSSPWPLPLVSWE
uniref:Sushi domain-containing protein n=1 Tax=Catharus ustulatus TaxID=91951 RepID=A0A8C3VCM6_CATUS